MTARNRPATDDASSRPEDVRTAFRLYARTLPGLEHLLAEEASRKSRSAHAVVAKGRIDVGPLTLDPAWRRLLVCDALCLVVRRAAGRFTGRQGLAEVRGKLSRTAFDRHLACLRGLGLPVAGTFRLRVSVAPACGFAFFDVLREGLPIVERRLGLRATEGPADLLVDLECLPDELTIGLALPLADWAHPPGKRLPRSLAGALLYLARPAPHVAVCDPDCGSGELLQAWRSTTGSGRLLGLTLPRRRQDPTSAGLPTAVASPRSWPVADGRLSRIISALPRVASAPQLAHVLDEASRCLAVGGRAAMATTLTEAWHAAVASQPGLVLEREVRVHMDGRPLDVIVLARQPGARRHRTPVTAGDRARAARRLVGAAGRPPRRPRRGQGATKKRSRPRRPGRAALS